MYVKFEKPRTVRITLPFRPITTFRDSASKKGLSSSGIQRKFSGIFFCFCGSSLINLLVYFRNLLHHLSRQNHVLFANMEKFDNFFLDDDSEDDVEIDVEEYFEEFFLEEDNNNEVVITLYVYFEYGLTLGLTYCILLFA